MEDNLQKNNGRRPTKKWKTTYKKMEEDINFLKRKTTSTKIKNGRQPQSQLKKSTLIVN